MGGGDDARKAAKQTENVENAAGLVVEEALYPWEGGKNEGGAKDAQKLIPDLPSGWETVVADDDGAVFYHHIDSGVTQWELPQ